MNDRVAITATGPLVPVLKGAFYGVLAAFFWYAFYIRYWEWRDCISQVETSCTEPGAWNATAAGQLWAIPAILFSVLAIKAAVVSVRRIARRDRPKD
jgi:cell division protein FtsX